MIPRKENGTCRLSDHKQGSRPQQRAAVPKLQRLTAGAKLNPQHAAEQEREKFFSPKFQEIYHLLSSVQQINLSAVSFPANTHAHTHSQFFFALQS